MFAGHLRARLGRVLFPALALLGCGAATPVDQSSVPLVWGAPADKAQCPVSDAVWAEYPSGEDCIRYFVGGAVDGAERVIVFFRADRHRLARRPPADIPENTARQQQAIADRMARRYGHPVILVERPGTYGSSGNHLRTRYSAEFLALNATLDRLRERYKLKSFVLYGHSGGATAAAALLTMGRRDISCAVLTSGAFSLLERARYMDARAGKTPRASLAAHVYDPLVHVDGIVPDSSRRIIMIGNEHDQITPFALQRKFADVVRKKGHRIDLINHAAIGPDFHNLTASVGMRTAASCAGGKA
ncbi:MULTISPECIES: alpha/beta fold hydrolase [Sphingobium]|uniref:AB hydrolase-1 domain-containing protein n=1 Tax=Sphingobium baderi TaxID=1332080 RepID=A0A0S3EZ14_9SPHN|nr:MULTISPECIES: alpha/beta fold hydrolase [Sphingobium]ALR20658.1 hypothetical protein ATN00_10445 [Sphingobium baderi]SCW79331.1 hypothetical protein SAMN02927924_02880 [Sphingobium faniae]